MTLAIISKGAIAALLITTSSQVHAQSDSPWTLTGTASLSASSFQLTDILKGQSEFSLFLDAAYLENYGTGVGFIRQDQGIKDSDDVVNDIFYLNGWYGWYPERVPGKVTLALNLYHGSESIRTASGGGSGNPNPGNPDPGNTDPGNPDPGNPDPGSGKPSPANVTVFTDSVSVFNPMISFMNYSKTLYLDLGLAQSDFKTSSSGVSDLQVTQWSPAIGLGLNDLYDWLQFRLFYIELSNDERTPGTDNTLAASASWTRWLKSKGSLKPEKFNVTLLAGERLYALDHDVRKLYNLTDMQTGSLIFGAHWKMAETFRFLLYSGYEQYRDVSANDNYDSLFIYAGLTNQW